MTDSKKNEEKKDPGGTPNPRKTKRDESRDVRVRITKPGNYVPNDDKDPASLRELGVDEVVTVSIGRANGMKNKCVILD